MKAGYQKPTIVFEDFELNTAIAAGCGTIVSLGPGDEDHPKVCEEYDQSPWSVKPDIGLMSNDPIDQPFYEGSCSCYLSSAGGTLLTS